MGAVKSWTLRAALELTAANESLLVVDPDDCCDDLCSQGTCCGSGAGESSIPPCSTLRLELELRVELELKLAFVVLVVAAAAVAVRTLLLSVNRASVRCKKREIDFTLV